MCITESEMFLGAAVGAALPYALTAIVEWGQRHSFSGWTDRLPRPCRRQRETA